MKGNIENKIQALGFSEIETIKIVYGMKLLFADLSKILIFVVIAIVIDKLLLFVWISLFTSLLRLNAGGFHFKRYWSCFVFAGMYYVMIFIFTSRDVNAITLIGLGLVSLAIIVNLAPKIPSERRKLKIINKKKLKLQSFLIAAVLVVFYIIETTPMTTAGIWVVIIQGVLLLSEEVLTCYKPQLKTLTKKL